MAEPEIISKRPSHPIASSLLVVAFLGVVGNIYLVQQELKFYVNADSKPILEQRATRRDQTTHLLNHYKEDFPQDLKAETLPWNAAAGDAGGAAGPATPGRGR